MNGQANRHDGPADGDAGTGEPGAQQAADAPRQQASAEAPAETVNETLTEAQARAQENWDRYLRAAAETENVRKRGTRDVENARRFALESFSRDLLPVKDSLEMGIQAAGNADAASLLEGKEATLKLLSTTLERFGIREVDPVGEPFDPAFHEAMTLQPSHEAEPGTVLTVVQKGYVLNGRLLRPAMVVVAAEPAGQ